jgi:hypothetical protein
MITDSANARMGDGTSFVGALGDGTSLLRAIGYGTLKPETVGALRIIQL